MTELISRYTEAEKFLIDKSHLRIAKIEKTTVKELSLECLVYPIIKIDKLFNEHPTYKKVVEIEFKRYPDDENLFEDILDLFLAETN